MGDQDAPKLDVIDEEFSDEELQILGEGAEGDGAEAEDKAEPDESATTTDEEEEGVETEDEEEEEAAGTDKDEQLTPEQKAIKDLQDRVGKLTAKGKGAEEKLELLKRDPKAYYEQYPDEKPEGYEEEPEKTATEIVGIPWGSAFEGGIFDGKTLKEAYRIDPKRAIAELHKANSLAAVELFAHHRDEQARVRQEEESRRNKHVEAAEKEIGILRESLAKTQLDKSVDDLTEEDKAKVDAVINETLDWMEQQRAKGNLISNINHAYVLRMTDELEKKTKASRALSGKLKIAAAGHVATGSSGDQATAHDDYGRYESMSDDDRAAFVANMTEERFDKFLQKAPAKFKESHPHLPW